MNVPLGGRENGITRRHTHLKRVVVCVRIISDWQSAGPLHELAPIPEPETSGMPATWPTMHMHINV